MRCKETVRETLEEWKFPILHEEDNAVVIRYQMNYIQITAIEDDVNGVAVTLTGIFTAENDREEILALKACNELNHRMMLSKVYLDEELDVVVAAEFYFRGEDDIDCLLDNALKAVVLAKTQFINKYEALVDRDTPLGQPEEEETSQRFKLS